jgi:hypothetical protein
VVFLGGTVIFLLLLCILKLKKKKKKKTDFLNNNLNETIKRYYILCLVVCGTIDSLLDFWNYFLFGYAQQRLIKDLRLCLFRKILSQVNVSLL